MKGLQRTTPDELGVLASFISIPTRCTKCIGFYGGYEVVGPLVVVGVIVVVGVVAASFSLL